jgi:hypothetical protein
VNSGFAANVGVPCTQDLSVIQDATATAWAFHRTWLIVQYEEESPTCPKIDCMSADVMGKPEKPLARQPPNDAHAELQSPPLLPRRQYAPFRAPPENVALWNMLRMFDTDATFHLLMSALNVPLKSEAMLVTAAVFHSTMLPYVATAVVGFVAHAVTAVPMFAFVMAVCACATGVKV